MSRNKNEIEQGNAAEAKGKTFKSFLEDRRDLKLFVEFSVIFIESKIELDRFETLLDRR